jgi:DNA gyrase/topoisomerase IV subunit B
MKEKNIVDHQTFPNSIRNKPEFLVGEPGRNAVNFLVDRLLRSLIWGASDGAEKFSVQVTTDNILKVQRQWGVDEKPFQALGEQWLDYKYESLAQALFNSCLAAIRSQKFEQHEWLNGNPYLSVYFPIALALAEHAKVALRVDGYLWTQSFQDGVPSSRFERSITDEKGSHLSLEIKLDSKLLGDEVQGYPFRVRLREFSAFVPSLQVAVKYKAFKPKEFNGEEGLVSLLNFFVPVDDRLHQDPFVFSFEENSVSYECAAFLLHSAMERFKSFADFDESYHGGPHDVLFRKSVRQVLRRFCKVEVPRKRRTLEMIASSRMSYFGQFGSPIPYQPEERKTQIARTLPGVAAVIRVRSPRLDWESNFRSRLVGPELEGIVGQPLSLAFRNWLLDHLDTVEEWRKQWLPKKRRKAKKKKKKKAVEPVTPDKLAE